MKNYPIACITLFAAIHAINLPVVFPNDGVPFRSQAAEQSAAFHEKHVINAFADSSASYALVAGGSKGIGYAIAEALARRHFNLILIARHLDSLFAAKSRLESL